MLKPYMAYSRESGAQEAAYLVFAHTAQESRIISFDGQITDDWIDWTTRYLKGCGFLFQYADIEKLDNGIPHCIDSPVCCKGCNLWGYELNEQGYCQECC